MSRHNELNAKIRDALGQPMDDLMQELSGKPSTFGDVYTRLFDMARQQLKSVPIEELLDLTAHLAAQSIVNHRLNGSENIQEIAHQVIDMLESVEGNKPFPTSGLVGDLDTSREHMKELMHNGIPKIPLDKLPPKIRQAMKDQQEEDNRKDNDE